MGWPAGRGGRPGADAQPRRTRRLLHRPAAALLIFSSGSRHRRAAHRRGARRRRRVQRRASRRASTTRSPVSPACWPSRPSAQWSPRSSRAPSTRGWPGLGSRPARPALAQARGKTLARVDPAAGDQAAHAVQTASVLRVPRRHLISAPLVAACGLLGLAASATHAARSGARTAPEASSPASHSTPRTNRHRLRSRRRRRRRRAQSPEASSASSCARASSNSWCACGLTFG